MTFAADLRSAWRNLRRGGWLSATVVLILAVAIASVTAIFSIAHTGAQTGDVVALVAREGLWIALATGLFGAWILRRSVASMLFGVSPGDTFTFVGVALVLGIVSLLSAYLPARGAARIDPVVALRAE